MPITQPLRIFRLLLVEDNAARVRDFRAWLPSWVHLVWAQSAGGAIGLIRRDRGHVYGGVLLDYDLQQRTMTEDDESLSGSNVALSLIEHFSIDVPILIHSTNVAQVPQIFRQLEGKGFWVTRIAFYDLTEALLIDWLEEAREIWEEFGLR